MSARPDPQLAPTDLMLTAFERDGFFVIRSGFSPDELRPVREACLRAWKATLDDGAHLHEQARLRPFLPEIHKRASAVADFCRHRLFVSLAKAIIGDEADQTWNQACLKAPERGDRTRFPIHQDGTFAEVSHPDTGFACFVAVNALSRENGGLGFARGYHKDMLPHTWSDAYSWWSCRVPEQDMTYPTLAPGDLVVYHPMTPHGGEPNHSDADREAFLVAFNAPGVFLVESGEAFGDQRPLLRAGQLADEVTTV